MIPPLEGTWDLRSSGEESQISLVDKNGFYELSDSTRAVEELHDSWLHEFWVKAVIFKTESSREIERRRTMARRRRSKI